MGLLYLFALVVGGGILAVQAAMGGHGDHAVGHGAGHGGHHTSSDDQGVGGFVALFLSTRFWIFAALGFGLSGTLLTYVLGGAFVHTLLIAVALGFGSGLLAAAAFRAASQAPTGTSSAHSAVGRIGRVLVPIDAGKTGQVRVEIDGSSVDLMAKTSEGAAERGEAVVIDDVEGEVATVSPAPEELKSVPGDPPEDG